MRTVELSEIFDVDYGNSLSLNSLTVCDVNNPKRVNFVSRTRENNGVSAYVEEIEDLPPFEAGLITVAGSGNSVLESFIQSSKFYTGFHVFILRPKINLSLEQKLFYCYCIRQNQFKYSYGRQANKTLKSILIPIVEAIPSWTSKAKNLKELSNNPFHNKSVSQKDRLWKWFVLGKLFDIKKGKRLTKANMKEGETPFIGATDSNNGLTGFIQKKAIFKGNTITVNYDGNGVAESYYQSVPYWALDSVNVLYPRFILNPFIAMFLITLLQKEKYRFSYGRKWHKARMEKSKIKLPVTKDGEPDWQFMEYYIKSLPYSSNLKENKKEKKGLSDAELIAKYESGSIDLGKQLKTAINKN